MWLLFLFLLLFYPCFFLSFLLLARHRIRSKAIEINKEQGPSSQNERMGCISCDRSRSRYMYYDDDDHDPYFRIGKGKEPRKNNEIRTSLAYLTYLYLPDNCYKPCPVSCLHSAYISRKFKQSRQGSRDRILPYLIRQLHYLYVHVSVSSERYITDRSKKSTPTGGY